MPLDGGRIQVLIVGDNAGMRDGVRALINSQPDMIIAGEATNCSEAVQQFTDLLPHITTVDVNRPATGGNETSREILLHFPEARIIVISALEGDAWIRQAFGIGVRAVLYQDMLRRELLPAIRAVHGGKQYIPETIASRLRGKP
jgi:DNA-binding NarL/FixJ family response regulator